MKHLRFSLLTLTLLICTAAKAQTVIASGNCGEVGSSLVWKIYDTGELVISGVGEIL